MIKETDIVISQTGGEMLQQHYPVTELTGSTSFAAESYEDKSLTQDTNFWVLIAFLIVVGIFLWQGVPGLISGFFKSRADTVRNQLDEARTIREEAQRMLADFQKRQREAEDEAVGIIEQAKRDAKLMEQDAQRKLEETVERRRIAAEDRIKRAEAQAIADIRGKTADLAVAAAREIISGRVDDNAQTALIDRSIDDIRGRLN